MKKNILVFLIISVLAASGCQKTGAADIYKKTQASCFVEYQT
jgi:outer membrane lipoprotein SlyB